MATIKKNKLKFRIRPINRNDKEWIKKFISQEWSSEIVVAHSKIFHPYNLLGFIAYRKNKYLGLTTYYIERKKLEIITMNAIIQGRGIGTALLKAVERVAHKLRCKKIWLITTNDNIDAIRFYQQKRFRIVTIHQNAIEVSRRLKPEIPFIGNYGIPIKDEVVLEKII